MGFYYLESDSTNPYFNLSVEEYLLDNLAVDDCVFYLWQNDKTVVIGRNQEAKAECDLQAMKDDGIKLARRCSGGGAVYHDLGNLNFSFVMPTEIYDVKRQLSVIVEGLRSLGMTAIVSGRNDLTVNDAKISGNAFINRKTHSLHHGTLLVSTDFSSMSRYLTPSVYKLRKKAVSSVSSRVINLCSIKEISIEELKKALIAAFIEQYDCKLDKLDEHFEIDDHLKRHQSSDHLYGKDDLKAHMIEGIYDDCYYKFAFDVKNNKVEDIILYSDSLKNDIEVLQNQLQNRGSEEILSILENWFSVEEATRLSERFREVLLAKEADFR